jgi:outer membrane scaffolding protein for murein synthesis (MipA/OmpV family)
MKLHKPLKTARLIVMIRNILAVIFAGLIIFMTGGNSFAEPQEKQDQKYDQDKEWSLRLGAIGMYKPEYEGSDDYGFQGFPLLIDISWRDTIFFNVRKGLGAYLWNRNDVKIGGSIGYTFGRDEDDSNDLDGLGDIDGGATANVFFEWKIVDISLSAHYEQQFTGEDTGFQVNAGLGYDLQPGEKIILKPSLKMTYSSSDYMEEYFSISAGQSGQSGLPVYDADSGFKSFGLQILAIYRLDRNWGLQAMVGYDRLVDDAADSPVVKDKDQYLIGAGLSYLF